MKSQVYYHPVTKEEMTKTAYFNFMFGEEFMVSKDKSKLKEYYI